jgi:DNA-binding SARP family transcriptional activator
MDFRILGPREVRDGSRPLALGGERQRAVLAILLLHRNEVVSADRLIDELWGEAPPAGARRTLRAYVSKLRRAMGANGAAPTANGHSEREPGRSSSPWVVWAWRRCCPSYGALASWNDHELL